MLKHTGIIIIAIAFSVNLALGDTFIKGRHSLVLDAESSMLAVDIAGGSIADFHLKTDAVNPLQWDSWSFSPHPEEPPTPDPRAMGHFLCLDRWGPPTEAEAANGMGWHGEASKVVWEIILPPQKTNHAIMAEMKATLPIAKLSIHREIILSDKEAFYTVRESVTNFNDLGRIYNMVQHPTIGPPFLDKNTLVDSNARKGFMQDTPLPNPEKPSVLWPEAITKDGKHVNIRHLDADHNPNVVSYTIDEDLGWVTASSTKTRLLIGYIWKTADYPWFNAWRHVKDGKPFARGLEFGTTGLHQPFPALVKKGNIFGRPLLDYIDANETDVRTYSCFLFTIPADFQGTKRITYKAGKLVLQEKSRGADRNLIMKVDDLFMSTTTN